MKKIEVTEIKASYDRLERNVKAVGLNELRNGKYRKAWEKAMDEYVLLLKTYAYAEFCNGVVGVVESDSINDAALVAQLATYRCLEGKLQFDSILQVLKDEYTAFVEQTISELEEMSNVYDMPIFIENTDFRNK